MPKETSDRKPKPPITIRKTLFIFGALATLVLAQLLISPPDFLSDLFEKETTPIKADEGSGQSEYIANELLVKINRDQKGKIKGGNPHDTGVVSINDKLKKITPLVLKRLLKLKTSIQMLKSTPGTR